MGDGLMPFLATCFVIDKFILYLFFLFGKIKPFLVVLALFLLRLLLLLLLLLHRLSQRWALPILDSWGAPPQESNIGRAPKTEGC